MKKVIFKEVNRCSDCPYFRHVDGDPNYEDACWFECGLTDNEFINDLDLRRYEEEDKYPWTIPDWCPLENYDIFHKAIDIVKGDA